MRSSIFYFSRIIFCICLCLSSAAVGAQKKKPVKKPAAAVQTQAPATATISENDIDRRIAAVEAELSLLQSKIELIRQDSIRVAGQLSAAAKGSVNLDSLEGILAKKSQELAAIKMQNEAARQDSLTLATKLAQKAEEQKREASRLYATVMAAANQLNSLSTQRQRIPVEETGKGNQIVGGYMRDIERNDSLVRIKQMELASLIQKRNQLHQDSGAAMQKASEARMRTGIEGARIDSILHITTSAMNDAQGNQTAIRQRAANNQDQAKLDELLKEQSRLDAQIKWIRTEIDAKNAERERLRSQSDNARQSVEQGRRPLLAALSSFETALQQMTGQQKVLSSLDNKLVLDSAVRSCKNALNSAIEQQAMRKKGAEKMVRQYEDELAGLMGRLDEVVRRNPRVAEQESKLANTLNTSQKRKQLAAIIASINAETATTLTRRDQAKLNLNEFDRTHASSIDVQAPYIRQLDSIIVLKKKSFTDLAGRRDSLGNTLVQLQRTVDTQNAAARTDARVADSTAMTIRKQKSDLALKRAAVRSDSMKNESIVMIELTRLRTEQSKINVAASACEREINSLNAAKERLTQSMADSQNKDKQTANESQMERKRLDSLIADKEKEVTALSVQNEKASQDIQALLRSNEQELRQQSASKASLAAQAYSMHQELASIRRQVEAARKERSAVQQVVLDKKNSIRREMAALQGAIQGKKYEITMLKTQRHSRQQDLKNQVTHLDSIINAEKTGIAALESGRDKIRQDSMAAEKAVRESDERHTAILRHQDSCIAALLGAVNVSNAELEKSRQDSAVKSVSAPNPALLFIATLDSQIALKEREIADLRRQREKARQDAVSGQKQQSSVGAAAHQDVMNRRGLLAKKQNEVAAEQMKRRKLQQDSANSVARIQATIHTFGSEIQRRNSLIAQKKDDLTTMQLQRNKLGTQYGAPAEQAPDVASAAPAAPSGPVDPVPSDADAAQKLMEEIYTLISSEKNNEAVARFNAKRSFLSKNVNSEVLQVLQYSIDQLSETNKKDNDQKK